MTLILIRKRYEKKKKLKKRDRLFIEHFKTKNGSFSEPSESIMVPTDSLAELDDILKKNTTHCFKITAGKTGWCATCRVKLSIYCQLHHFLLFTSRPKLKKDNQVFVNRQKMALRDQITQMKWRLLPHLR